MNRSSLTYWLMLGLVASVVMIACKEKRITGPDNPNPGVFRLELRANDTLVYNVNNNVTVRLFRGDVLAVNDTVLFQTEAATSNMVNSLVIPQSDTLAHPCGANPCARYTCSDTTVAKDAIFGYAISNGDTVATAAIGFFLRR